MRAAGIAIHDPESRILFLRRAGDGDHVGEWCFPGGGLEQGETAADAARREVREEIGYNVAPDRVAPAFRTSATGVDYATFKHFADKAFRPKLNDEHDNFVWRPASNPPEPLHPGVKAYFDNESSPQARDCVAMDRSSIRSYDKDGRLHVSLTNISKANVCPYYGHEIPKAKELGLDLQKRYKLLRDPEELTKAASTFNNLPVLSRHVPVNVEDHQPELVVGSTGTDAVFEAPYLRNSMVVWSRDSIAGIESEEQKELSAAYHYRADMTPGEYEGEPYDGVMRDIVGNHVAVIRSGRAGSDVVVGDSKLEIQIMAKGKMSSKALFAQGAILAFLRPKLAMDASIDLTPALAKVTNANFKAQIPSIVKAVGKATTGKLAMDADIEDLAELLDAFSDQKVGDVEALDADNNLPGAGQGGSSGAGASPSIGEHQRGASISDINAAEGSDNVGLMVDDDEDGADPMAAVEAFLKEKLGDEGFAEFETLMAAVNPDGEDAPEEDEVTEEDPVNTETTDPVDPDKEKDMIDKPAMDAAINSAVKRATANAVTIQREIRDAERAVRPYVGDLNMAFDSAEGVYRATLKALGVKVDGVHASALPAMLSMVPKKDERPARKSSLAMDAAPLADFHSRFPGAANIAR